MEDCPQCGRPKEARRWFVGSTVWEYECRFGHKWQIRLTFKEHGELRTKAREFQEWVNSSKGEDDGCGDSGDS